MSHLSPHSAGRCIRSFRTTNEEESDRTLVLNGLSRQRFLKRKALNGNRYRFRGCFGRSGLCIAVRFPFCSTRSWHSLLQNQLNATAESADPPRIAAQFSIIF